MYSGRLPIVMSSCFFLSSLFSMNLKELAARKILDERDLYCATRSSIDVKNRLAYYFCCDHADVFWQLLGEEIAVELSEEMKELKSCVTETLFLPGQSQAITATSQGRLILWDTENWAPKDFIKDHMGRINVHNGRVNGIRISPNKELFATVGEDGNVFIWSLASLKVVGNLSLECEIFAIDWNKSLTIMAVGTANGIYVYEYPNLITKYSILSYQVRLDTDMKIIDDKLIFASNVKRVEWNLADGIESKQPILFRYGGACRKVIIDSKHTTFCTNANKLKCMEADLEFGLPVSGIIAMSVADSYVLAGGLDGTYAFLFRYSQAGWTKICTFEVNSPRYISMVVLDRLKDSCIIGSADGVIKVFSFTHLANRLTLEDAEFLLTLVPNIGKELDQNLIDRYLALDPLVQYSLSKKITINRINSIKK